MDPSDLNASSQNFSSLGNTPDGASCPKTDFVLSSSAQNFSTSRRSTVGATGSVNGNTNVIQVDGYVLSRPKYGDIRNYSRQDALDIMYKYRTDYFAFQQRIRKLRKRESLTEIEQNELSKAIIGLNNVNMDMCRISSAHQIGFYSDDEHPVKTKINEPAASDLP